MGKHVVDCFGNRIGVGDSVVALLRDSKSDKDGFAVYVVFATVDSVGQGTPESSLTPGVLENDRDCSVMIRPFSCLDRDSYRWNDGGNYSYTRNKYPYLTSARGGSRLREITACDRIMLCPSFMVPEAGSCGRQVPVPEGVDPDQWWLHRNMLGDRLQVGDVVFPAKRYHDELSPVGVGVVTGFTNKQVRVRNLFIWEGEGWPDDRPLVLNPGPTGRKKDPAYRGDNLLPVIGLMVENGLVGF